MMFKFGNNWPLWQVALMWIGMIAFWGMLIWGVYTFATNATRKPAADQLNRNRDGAGAARQMLDQRLAKGEIDADEYRQMRDLSDDHKCAPVNSANRQ